MSNGHDDDNRHQPRGPRQPGLWHHPDYQDPDEDEPVCLGESVEMMEIVDEYIPEDSVPPSL